MDRTTKGYEALNKIQSTLNQEECGSLNIPVEEVTLLDRIRQKRQQLVRETNAKVREFNRIERLLIQSEAESVIKEAQELLW